MSERLTDTAGVKQEIRERVTRVLLDSKVVLPDPVFHLSLEHYIADFEGNEVATQKLAQLELWQKAKRIFITPDRSTQRARELAIRQEKEIVVTTYGIARGAVLLNRTLVPAGQESFAASLDGLEHFGEVLPGVRDIQRAGEIDLMLTGALAISLAHGGRAGKGAGWFDAEWIMWRNMNLIRPVTPVVGIVHDLQVVAEPFPLDAWDAVVGIIVTPTRVLTTPPRAQPEEIYWEQMNPAWLTAIPLMLELYEQLNKKAYLPPRG